jgi:hypothetical protein
MVTASGIAGTVGPPALSNGDWWVFVAPTAALDGERKKTASTTRTKEVPITLRTAPTDHRWAALPSGKHRSTELSGRTWPSRSIFSLSPSAQVDQHRLDQGVHSRIAGWPRRHGPQLGGQGPELVAEMTLRIIPKRSLVRFPGRPHRGNPIVVDSQFADASARRPIPSSELIVLGALKTVRLTNREEDPAPLRCRKRSGERGVHLGVCLLRVSRADCDGGRIAAANPCSSS